MTLSGDSLSGQSQNFVSAGADAITVDRKKMKKLLSATQRCIDFIDAVNNAEIMLCCLDTYLVEEKEPNYNKAILLLRYWLDVNPERLKRTSSELDEIFQTLKTVLSVRNQ